MRLIDADALIENKFKNDISYNAFVSLVKRQPSAPPERIRGRWIPWDGDDCYECSACRGLWTFPDGTPEENGANFCPNCGADMREDSDG